MVALSPELPGRNGGNKKPAVRHGGFGKFQILEPRRRLARIAQATLARFATLFGSGHAQLPSSAAFSADFGIGMCGLENINAGKLRQGCCVVNYNPGNLY